MNEKKIGKAGNASMVKTLKKWYFLNDLKFSMKEMGGSWLEFSHPLDHHRI